MGTHRAARTFSWPPSRSRHPWLLVALAAAVAALVAGTLVVRPGPLAAAGSTRLWPFAEEPAPACTPAQVRLVVDPQIIQPVQDILADRNGTRLPDGRCLRAEIESQASQDTLRDAATLPVTAAPDLWIPDSSLWPAQVARGWTLRPRARLALSPLVVASGKARIDRLGWTGDAPSWPQVVPAARPATVQGPASDTAGIHALLGVWQLLGRGVEAERVVAAAVLAWKRAQRTTADTALRAAVAGARNAPLLLTDELTVARTNRDEGRKALVGVRPRGPVPGLDYPVVEVARPGGDAGRAVAVASVVTALTAPSARDVLRRFGLRDAPKGAAGQALAAALPSRATLSGFLGKLSLLETPTHLLTVIDVSTSMVAQVPGSPLNRIQLAGAAAVGAGDSLPDDAIIGLWAFAARLDGRKPFKELSPMAPLGSPDGGRTHREVLIGRLRSLGSLLSPNGTALYATVRAAMRQARRDFDPTAVNSVVLFTDGRNERDRSVALDDLLAELRADTAANPGRPVSLITIGIGPDADVAVLRKLAQATGGTSYRADRVEEMTAVIFDALAHRA